MKEKGTVVTAAEITGIFFKELAKIAARRRRKKK